MMDHPQPAIAPADAQACLIRGKRRAGQKPCPDARELPGKAAPGLGQHVDQRALADADPETFLQEPRKPVQGNALRETQIEDHGAQARAKGRAVRHILRRRRLEAPGAVRAAPAMQIDACHHRGDRRQIDHVVGFAHRLPRLAHIARAAWAA